MRRSAGLTIALLALIALLVAGLTHPRVHAAGEVPVSLGGIIGQDPIVHRLYVAQPAANKILVFDSTVSTAMKVLGEFSVPAHPAAIAVDTVRHLVYVASDDSSVLTRFNGRTLKKLNTLQMSGRPGGLALLYGGNVLLITDALSGEVSQLPVEPAIGHVTRVLSTASGPDPAVFLTPDSTWGGKNVLVWACGFLPGEIVQVSWGMVPLVKLKADEIGSIMGQFTVPKPTNAKKPDLGPHLVVLIGQQSSRSQSGLLDVVKIPPPPVVVKPLPPPPPSAMSLKLKTLFGIKVTFALPGPLAIGPLKGHKVSIAWMYLVYVYIAVTMMLLILRRARRRKAPPPEKDKGKKKRPAPQRAALRAKTAS